MFEDVFEPLDDIIGDTKEASDEWGEVWDTGEKEDMWRADPKDVWSVAPANQPVTHPGPVTPAPAPGNPKPNLPDPVISPPGPMNKTPEDDCGECDTECEKEKCEAPCDQGGGSGLFDDLFLDI